jgi:thioredoxin 1
VDDTNDHGPDGAAVVTILNADSLLNSRRIGVIEFYSARCPVCAGLTWVIDSLSNDFSDSVFSGANNTDDDTLYKRFSISSVPTYILFKDRAEITRRSFTENKSWVYDTVASLLRGIMRGIIPDTSDTVSPPDTAPPANYLTLDTLTFDTTVLRTGRTAMVFFLDAGGAPSVYMDSVVSAIAPFYKNRAIIAKVHAWEQMPLPERYGINRVPWFLFFKDSALVESKSGSIDGNALRATLDRLLAPAAAPVPLNGTNFDSVVSVPGRIAMVDFYSPLCPACRIMEDTVSSLAVKYNGKAAVCKVNVDISDSLRMAHNVSMWPTFIFYDGGAEYDRIAGIVPEDSLAAVLDRGLAR